MVRLGYGIIGLYCCSSGIFIDFRFGGSFGSSSYWVNRRCCLYAAIVGEEGFSFWTAIGLGIRGAILEAVAHFTGAAAAVFGLLTQAALHWLTRVALPAIGRLLLRGWRDIYCNINAAFCWDLKLPSHFSSIALS
ncbi:hypothetical protein TherJR_0391 [Thermincola potens JR]|uniref:Uncharacterized protein n=1 Tax=Thermincola potens (strain JR) TaxID=635013 RepID=D5XAH8_THEPJ|nr:hypothetical protein TherJR_0391 [Thermincola potens JR]